MSKKGLSQNDVYDITKRQPLFNIWGKISKIVKSQGSIPDFTILLLYLGTPKERIL